ncbi:hypothetical protein [Halorubellus salinus]|uniref:hypothetical protein n=1 Tax=Halorubellus salinus TaxID=755309 RepID=UPI001D0896AE|nr:hypothetical protein [Halorubellus salinus]
MSTRTDATYDDPTTASTHTDATTTDFSANAENPQPASGDSRPTTGDAPTPHGDVPWTERCKRQFSTTDTNRMRNLNDDQNQAMQDGV